MDRKNNKNNNSGQLNSLFLLVTTTASKYSVNTIKQIKTKGKKCRYVGQVYVYIIFHGIVNAGHK
jgi:hypothetical protein